MSKKLSGFPEFLPSERIVEQQVLDHLRRTFELHGFANIETRAVEPLDVLLRKGEIDKEVYAVKRLAAADDEPAELALHYDLTVPFARYVLENAGKLDFPFRRWQIQKVWRGERPQQGRFREFTQADIDIVARDVLPFHFDVEVARVMAEALAGLPIPTATLQISNRKILEGFYLGLGITDPVAVMQVVDKLDKVPAERIHELLVEQGLDASQADRVLALAEIVTTDTSFVGRVEALGVEHELLAEGVAELAQVVDGASGVDGVVVTADLRIARGLDYYTGTVFETRLEGWEHLGSICSGGRYDELAKDRRSTYPGVGISLGVSRLLVPLALSASRSVPSAVLVAVDDEDSRADSTAIAQQLRARGIPTEVAAKADRFGKQIQYAEKRGIPYVWFPPTSVKDIRSGDQVEASPDTWSPPTSDLTPTILPKEQLS
ncbi:histidine--tRNA ligase [Aeromicrobium fastidiosum]|uniref:Histidine--tRNA ligase n=1 Tax=Aeromicrobium fastidiosum TaxID=52699 RepID=A0A641AMJ9_9ACTN|nr:histidine--tRNA ligase [Aeromicrobium fastidiosum]KAA1376154.1 histidine--tRNA ligase [Aeromicrobium fastidiosum]MBP2391960.1 histidyl-tRNA synthetase [Aeromicrobium fastidiosum]